MKLAVCTALLVLVFLNGVAWADRLVVVDVERIFRESTPGKAGEAHLQHVRSVLQKGLDDLLALYKGKENTPEAVATIREGHAALERQFAAERLAVRQVLAAHLENVVRVWFATANAKKATISAVAPASAFFAHGKSLDVTEAVMREMNKEKPVFPALPTVTVQQSPQAATGKNEAAPARQPARSR